MGAKLRESFDVELWEKRKVHDTPHGFFAKMMGREAARVSGNLSRRVTVVVIVVDQKFLYCSPRSHCCKHAVGSQCLDSLKGPLGAVKPSSIAKRS